MVAQYALSCSSGPATLRSFGLMAVPIQPGSTFQAGKPELLFSGNSGTTGYPAPDGKQFLIETSPTTNVAAGGANVAVVTDWFEELKRRAPAKK